MTDAGHRTSGRAVKRRMDYNEDSDAAEDVAKRRHQSRASVIVVAAAPTQEEEEAVAAAIDDDEHDEEEEEEAEPTVSVSSRGRVRKIIAKARRIFRE